MTEASDDQRLRKGAATRLRILDAAAEIFSSKGYAATRVGEIARVAGVEKAALYWHFKSKEELFAEVIESIDTAWIEGIWKHTKEVSDSDEQLDRLVAGLRRLVTENSQMLRLMMNTALERSAASPTSKRAVQRMLDRTSLAIQEGFAAELGTPLPDGDLIARLILGYLFEATLRSSVSPDQVELERLFDHLRRLISLDIAAQIRSMRD